MKTKFVIFILLFLLLRCNNNPLKVDVSGIDIKLNIQHFEKDLKNVNLDNIGENIVFLEEKYGEFFAIYNNLVIQIGNADAPDYPAYLETFLKAPVFAEVYDTCQTVFQNFEPIKKQLVKAFKHYKYYFPKKSIPSIYTFMSGFNQSIIIDTDILGIGLDKYLGENCVFYEYLNYPIYLRKRLAPERIVYDCMYAIGSTDFPFKSLKDDFVSNCIYEGKILYFINAMIPTATEKDLLNYTEEQLLWAQQNEKNVWKYLVDKEYLFSSDRRTINNFINEAPFTPDFSNNSAPKMGTYIGWKIVQAYIKNNAKVSLPEFLDNSDYQNIFANSNYIP